jgi:hypothetical protein
MNLPSSRCERVIRLCSSHKIQGIRALVPVGRPAKPLNVTSKTDNAGGGPQAPDPLPASDVVIERPQ